MLIKLYHHHQRHFLGKGCSLCCLTLYLSWMAFGNLFILLCLTPANMLWVKTSSCEPKIWVANTKLLISTLFQGHWQVLSRNITLISAIYSFTLDKFRYQVRNSHNAAVKVPFIKTKASTYVVCCFILIELRYTDSWLSLLTYTTPVCLAHLIISPLCLVDIQYVLY